MFKVKEVQETNIHTYLFENLNEEEITGSFYSFELISVANQNCFIRFNCSASSYLFIVFDRYVSMLMDC